MGPPLLPHAHAHTVFTATSAVSKAQSIAGTSTAPRVMLPVIFTHAPYACNLPQVVDMVLATDMKQHFSLLTQFTALHKARKVGLNGDGGGHGANGKGLTPPATTAGGGGTTSNDSSTQRQQQQQGPQQMLRSPAAATRAGG